VTKGIERETLARPSEIIHETAPASPIGVLSGPSIAPEVARCLPATVVVASESPAVAELIQTVLSTSWFRVYTNPDVLGVELAGALKNVIAIAAGILDGLKAGDNAKAALVTRGLVEITRLGVAMGARPQTFVGLAGIGDLVTTCVSPLGRNRSAGERIGRGVDAAQVVRDSPSVIEGIPTTRSVMELSARHEVEMPITRAVYEVLFENKAPLTAITELMNRPPKAEGAH
jgi:glycerol-3-phosphate dehydrogenase (NAD(P)+)